MGRTCFSLLLKVPSGFFCQTIYILYIIYYREKSSSSYSEKSFGLRLLRHAFERIVFELPAVVAGSDKAALGAEIRFVVELPGVDTVGAESVDLFSEQHAGHLLFCYYTAAWRKFPARIFRRRGASSGASGQRSGRQQRGRRRRKAGEGQHGREQAMQQLCGKVTVRTKPRRLPEAHGLKMDAKPAPAHQKGAGGLCAGAGEQQNAAGKLERAAGQRLASRFGSRAVSRRRAARRASTRKRR